MRLVLYSDLRGIWLEDSEGERLIAPERTTVDITVTDGTGRVVSGNLRILGVSHPVDHGKCKLNTEYFARYCSTPVVFVTTGGVSRVCANICPASRGGWKFPLPSESVDDGEILRMLCKIERLEAKLDAARALCSETVSGVLGI